MSYIRRKNSLKKDENSSKDLLSCGYAYKGELSSNLVSFCRYLRIRGLFLSMSELIDAMCALQKLDFQDENSFRIALRTTLAKSNEEQKIFDKYFRSFWYEGGDDNWDRNIESKKEELSNIVIDERPQKQGFISINDWLGKKQDTEELKDISGYSPFEVKSERDFSTFKGEELLEIMQLVIEIGKSMANCLSRRTINSKKKGSIDFQRTIRDSFRFGGEIINLKHSQRRRKRLKLVLICDVSKSMDLYSRFLIQFIYAFQFVYRRIETFVFSTSLNRITDILRTEELFSVLEQLSEIVPDWSGGTKIGASLEEFVKKYGSKLVDSHTVCLIISDGWDTGDVDLLERSMSYLKKKSLNIIWLNPLKGNPSFEPSTRGMQAAIPYIDIFASAHNLSSLKNLARKLTKIQTNY